MERLGIVDELQERHDTLAPRMSPAARQQAFPSRYARPLPREKESGDDHALIRAELAALRSELAKVRQEVECLTGLVSDTPAAKGRKMFIRPESVKRTFCECMNVFDITVSGEPWQMRHFEDAARGDAYAQPRMICMWLVKRICPGLSFPKVGLLFNRDHTTVLHAMKRVPEVMENRPDLRLVAMGVLRTYGSPWPEMLGGEPQP